MPVTLPVRSLADAAAAGATVYGPEDRDPRAGRPLSDSQPSTCTEGSGSGAGVTSHGEPLSGPAGR